MSLSLKYETFENWDDKNNHHRNGISAFGVNDINHWAKLIVCKLRYCIFINIYQYSYKLAIIASLL